MDQTDTRAKRFNTGKPKLSLIPSKANVAEAAVWTMGAEKYGANNWQKGMPFTEVLDSLGRHYEAIKNGEDIDEESGQPHAAHIRCNAAMLIEYLTTHPECDDRHKA